MPGALDLTRDERFTEQKRVDDGSGVVNRELYHYGARFYLPGVGLFSQPDSIVPSPTNPQALNRYAYCYNNPIRFTDPSGRFVIIPAAAAAVAVYGFIGGALVGGLSGGAHVFVSQPRATPAAVVEGVIAGALLGGTLAAVGAVAMGTSAMAVGLAVSGEAVMGTAVAIMNSPLTLGAVAAVSSLGTGGSLLQAAATGVTAARLGSGQYATRLANGPIAKSMTPAVKDFALSQASAIGPTTAVGEAVGWAETHGPEIQSAVSSAAETLGDVFATSSPNPSHIENAHWEPGAEGWSDVGTNPIWAFSSGTGSTGYGDERDYWANTNIGCY